MQSSNKDIFKRNIKEGKQRETKTVKMAKHKKIGFPQSSLFLFLMAEEASEGW